MGLIGEIEAVEKKLCNREEEKMKSSRHILLVMIVLVMTIVFASSVFAQVTPTQPSTKPPILQKTDPNQKLRELQAAENNKKKSRQLALKAEITKLVQKDIEMAKTKKKVEICTSPKIFSVSSREVYPGEPVYIRGCGFGITKGMVAILPLNRQLEIETWVDGRIVGKIPPDITGFADPKTITLKVVTIQGNASEPSESLTLKPNLEIKALMITQPTISDPSCGYPPEFTADYTRISHWNHRGQPCQGRDTLFQPLQLKNNWAYYSYDFRFLCYHEARHGNPSGCDSLGGQANLVQNMNLLLGKSNIPRIEIDWCIGPAPVNLNLYVGISYDFQIFVFGPAGTNYR